MIYRPNFDGDTAAVEEIAPDLNYWPRSRQLPGYPNSSSFVPGRTLYSVTRVCPDGDRALSWEARRWSVVLDQRWGSPVTSGPKKEKSAKRARDRDPSSYGTGLVTEKIGRPGPFYTPDYAPVELAWAYRPQQPPPDCARAESPIEVSEIPLQPQELWNPSAKDRSYFDYRKRQWFAERYFDLPFKKDASTFKRPVVAREKEIISEVRFQNILPIWRERYGRLAGSVWVFKDTPVAHFQEYQHDSSTFPSSVDKASMTVAVARSAIKTDLGEELYDSTFEYVTEDIFSLSIDGLAPIDLPTTEPADDKPIDGIYASHVCDLIRVVPADEYDRGVFHCPPPAYANRFTNDVRFWKKFDVTYSTRPVASVHSTDKHWTYDNPVVLRLGRAVPGVDRVMHEPVSAILTVPARGGTTKTVSALLMPALRPIDDRLGMERPGSFWNVAVRQNILAALEAQDIANDRAFEQMRIEAKKLKAGRSAAYFESSDYYYALADDDVVSPSVGRDLGKCSYGPEIRGIRFSLASKATVKERLDGHWYDSSFKAPVYKSVAPASKIDVSKVYQGRKHPIGIETTLRVRQRKISVAAAAAVEGIPEEAMRQRIKRVANATKTAANVNYDFERLSMRDLNLVMTGGFYVVLPPARRGYADILIPVDVDAAGRDLSQPIEVGALLASKQDEIIGGLWLDAFRGAVRAIRLKGGRNQDRAIGTARARMTRQFDRAQLFYFEGHKNGKA